MFDQVLNMPLLTMNSFSRGKVMLKAAIRHLKSYEQYATIFAKNAILDAEYRIQSSEYASGKVG